MKNIKSLIVATYTPNPFVERVQTRARPSLIENIFLATTTCGTLLKEKR
jgi:hypothetical protein